MYHLCKFNIIGSSGDVFPNLSAGAHSINFQFTPAGSCDAFPLQLVIKFSIAQPTPAPTTRPSKTSIVQEYIWRMIWHPIATVSIMGSVTVDENTATITLNSNLDGVFQCSLDGGAFENCMVFILCVLLLAVLLFKGQSGDTFTGLSDGAHTMDVWFTPEGSSQMLNFHQWRFSIGNNSCYMFTVYSQCT